MSDPEKPQPKDVLAIVEATEEGQKTRWPRIGAAFDNRDGSLTILLDSLPFGRKLQVRERRPKPAQDDES